MKRIIKDIKHITPVHYQGSNNIKYNGNHLVSRVFGVTNDFFKIKDWDIEKGREFSEGEITTRI